ncbi:extracellular solute-binding protein [Pigmentiphaga soli]|uniref:Extracellular solute-binding protein n=1 Tax=Pigmentiphaga soli TaxID=1007095 RepID=A0ABP8GDU4_9BURK
MFDSTRLLSLGCSLLTGAVLAAQAAHAQVSNLDPALLAAANKEGTVNLYTTQDPAATKKTLEAFHKAYPGISVRSLRPGGSGVLLARFMQETNAGVHQADIIQANITQIYSDMPALYKPMTAELVPTLPTIPQKYVKERYFTTTETPMTFAYNKNSLKGDEVPRAWKDVLNPKLKGRGLLADPRNTDNFMYLLDVWAKTYGDDFLVKLKAQQYRMVAGGSQGAQEVAAGGAGPAFITNLFTTHSAPVIARGAPLVTVRDIFTNSGMPALANYGHWAITEKAPHPAAARVFLAWLITPEGQQANCVEGANSSLLLNDQNRGKCLPAITTAVQPVDAPFPADRKAHLLGLLGLQ